MRTFYPSLAILFVVILILSFKNVSAQNFHLVKDINTAPNSNTGGTDSAKIAYLTPLKNKVVFIANSGYGRTNFDLWSSDGTSAGTQIIKDTVVPNRSSPFFASTPLIVAGSNAYYFYNTNDKVILFKTDGTSAGTIAIDTFDATTEFVGELGATDSMFYYTLTKTVNNQRVTEIWHTDGTRANTVSIGSNPIYQQGISYAGKNGNSLYFSILNGIQMQLWVTDGTQPGTVKIGDFVGLSPGYAYNGNFIFGGGKSLWSTDGTAGGLKLLRQSLTYISDFAISDSVLFFSAHDELGPYGNPGFGLYKTNGTPEGTELVKQISPYGLTDVNGVLYFLGTEYNANLPDKYGLWKSDGTIDGTQLVKSFDYIGPQRMAALNGRIYFVVYDANNNYDLWESDGTDAGTHRVNDAGLTGVKVYDYYQRNNLLVVAANKLFFTGTNNAYANELWVGDVGTTLPLTLINFAATLAGNDGDLQWTVTSNVIDQAFELERSIDGIHFSTIAKVPAGNISSDNTFGYIDKNLDDLPAQKVYYRLRITDINGRVTYSKIIVLNLQKGNIQITVAPNPVMQNLLIKSLVAIPGATIKITDLTGKTLITAKQNISSNSTVSINVSSLSKGGYVVTVTGPALTYSLKIIKN